ncbi:MAG TPA: phage tail protein [Oligoflexus sp.]|uniref:phage tail protein n=1 Tax=Oligoflexus sp. TaxID=1971216 RepID=UPI002D7FD929|nr:phage tail protein [Oligoflexus sp.]HET9238841.1 phage tail protein [Oligoflexus sp.]
MKRQAVPVGTVVAFAGNSIPKGWLLCDGSAYAKATYPDLFNALNSTYATQVNNTTGTSFAAPDENMFRVPDYRGVFLRGTGANSLGVTTQLGGWPDDSTAVNSLTAASSSRSTSQSTVSDPGHAHTLSQNANFWRLGGNGAGLNAPGLNNTAIFFLEVQKAQTGIGVSTSTSTETSTTLSGAAETRPQNRGVQYIIKAGY